MKPEELRIGNWTTYKGKYVQVELSHFKDESDNRRVIEHMRPLHLTEEWLEKLGFEKRAGRMWCINDSNKYSGFFIKVWSNGLYECRLYGTNILDDCKYVHQLQNIIFALTGEELK